MIANGTAAYGMYPRTVCLSNVVSALNRAGFENNDICMVLSPAHPDAELAREPNIFDRKPSDCATSARMIRWFSKFGAVVIPTVGFFARSQAFMQVLVSEPIASPLSRGARILLGLGFSHDEAARLGTQLCDFGALIYVSCQESTKAHGAIELLREAGAREAASLGLSKAGAVAA